MKTIPLARLLAIALLIGVRARVDAEEKLPPAFSALSFEAASDQAASEHKIVFIDFFTTWCAPCKMLDETTWQDATVIALLREKSVALKIDAEIEKTLARRYQLNAYPTLLLLKPDGTEIDRIVGYREAAKFIEEFSAGLAGQTAIQRARAAVANASNEHDRVKARYDLGQELARTGQSEAALAEYLWCYDEGMVKEPSFRGVRASYLLGSITDLGKEYPPALASLKTRRDKAQAAFVAGAVDPAVVRELVPLNRALYESEKSLALYDQLAATDSRRQLLGRSLLLLFISTRRYADAVATEPFDAIKQRWSSMQQPQPADTSERFRQIEHDFSLRWLATQLEVLAGAGQLGNAREFLATALAFDRSADAQTLFHEHLTRAGHAELLTPTDGVAVTK